ncbi:DMT family transporter [Vibrio mediterranei]|uniref:DMT family transporter n=1 Tax=Vibrio mediterranei TaxID=689 RepID=UPI004068F76B
MNKDLSLALAAMTAFALNSLFCRFALERASIDPVSFTLVRLISGALTLLILASILSNPRNANAAAKFGFGLSIRLGASLFGYALLFSLAYISLDTGTGALILFGTVQLTLIAYHRLSGNQISPAEWLGIAIALAGFVLLLLPSASQPSLLGSVLMMLSGLCWAIFTLLGKQVTSPIFATRQGFVVASLLVLPVFIINWRVEVVATVFTTQGLIYALLSGSLASAIGYFLWYSLLPKIDVLEASLLQLTVPIIAMILGWFIIGETMTFLSLSAAALILGGIALVSWFKLQRE